MSVKDLMDIDSCLKHFSVDQVGGPADRPTVSLAGKQLGGASCTLLDIWLP